MKTLSCRGHPGKCDAPDSSTNHMEQILNCKMSAFEVPTPMDLYGCRGPWILNEAPTEPFDRYFKAQPYTN
ncbi:hypothetical protein POX_a01847 [Penicillium oxalicum]|uniref:Uncharacterized protein n=1 Tax=Penicillium oxalicum (strain 114-2 / CGMCC 5302) TaxID=933388 RepID=S8B2U2_PENO1|nr:hypothetical protein POX_a01847 [Penicillium oxalicum]EPS33158.1 hypothetical protein PDE_08120 [Penicillium oxalicum 114-2]KAI2795242.1 hypothetical protein POX_a01847 [Penicillium oxalicum]